MVYLKKDDKPWNFQKLKHRLLLILHQKNQWFEDQDSETNQAAGVYQRKSNDTLVRFRLADVTLKRNLGTKPSYLPQFYVKQNPRCRSTEVKATQKP